MRRELERTGLVDEFGEDACSWIAWPALLKASNNGSLRKAELAAVDDDAPDHDIERHPVWVPFRR